MTAAAMILCSTRTALIMFYNTISNNLILMLLLHLYIIDRSSIRSSNGTVILYAIIALRVTSSVNITVYRAFFVFCTMTRIEKSTRKQQRSPE